MAKLTETEVRLFKKFRAFTKGDLFPWNGGDEMEPLPLMMEQNESIKPLRSSIFPRKHRFFWGEKENRNGDSHGHRGRKPRKTHWTRDSIAF